MTIAGKHFKLPIASKPKKGSHYVETIKPTRTPYTSNLLTNRGTEGTIRVS